MERVPSFIQPSLLIFRSHAACCLPMSLSGHRRAIDGLDSRIVKLLNERTGHVQAIGHIKLMAGEEIYAPHRERAVLDRVCARNTGPLSHSQLRAIYREIMSSALALEKPMTIAFPGPESSQAGQAALRRFGSSLSYRAEKDFAFVCEAVASARVDYGVLPEDFYKGKKGASVLKWFSKSGIKIVSQIRLPSALGLLGLSRRNAIHHIYLSSPDLPGCRTWLTLHFPKARIIAVSSQVQAVKRVSQSGAAAVAHPDFARNNGLKMLQPVVQDASRADFRFLVIGRQCSPPTGDDTTSLLVSKPPGNNSPSEITAILERCKVPMKRVKPESMMGKRGECAWFIDCQGHMENAKVAGAVRRLAKSGLSVQVLGSYPNLE